jgi:hypothetical protein
MVKFRRRLLLRSTKGMNLKWGWRGVDVARYK